MFLPNLGIIRENVEVGIIIRWKKISNLGLSLQMSSFTFVNEPGEKCLFWRSAFCEPGEKYFGR